MRECSPENYTLFLPGCGVTIAWDIYVQPASLTYWRHPVYIARCMQEKYGADLAAKPTPHVAGTSYVIQLTPTSSGQNDPGCFNPTNCCGTWVDRLRKKSPLHHELPPFPTQPWGNVWTIEISSSYFSHIINAMKEKYNQCQNFSFLITSPPQRNGIKSDQ